MWLAPMPIMTIVRESEAIGGRRSCGGAVSLLWPHCSTEPWNNGFYREIIPKWPWNIIIYPVSVLICSRMMFPIRYGRFYLLSKVTIFFCVRLEFIVRFTSITSRRQILQASKQVLFSLQVGKLWWRVHPPKSKLGLIKGNIISL